VALVVTTKGIPKPLSNEGLLYLLATRVATQKIFNPYKKRKSLIFRDLI